jgi:PRTRC genetic system protein A
MNPLDTIIAQPDEELPNEDVIFYAATNKGWVINVPTLFGNAQLLSKEAPTHLPPPAERFILNGKQIPLHMLTQFHDFARKNFEKRRAECSAYLTYNPETDDWKLFIPEQYVSHTSVNHKLDPGQIKDGYQAVGTIHSHCDFNAFHSGTDKHDMGKMPGLHITIGHVNTDTPDYDFALSVHDAAFDVKYDKIVDVERPLDRNGYATAPDHWLQYVKEGQAPWGFKGGVQTTYTPKHRGHGGYTQFNPAKTHRPIQRPMQQHWSQWDHDAWTDEDYTWYQKTGTVQQHLFKGEKGKSDHAEPFDKYSDEVEQSEQTMESEAFFLALKGFVLGYNITYNPKKAEQWLKSQGVFYSIGDDDDTALLPELAESKNDATDAA